MRSRNLRAISIPSAASPPSSKVFFSKYFCMTLYNKYNRKKILSHFFEKNCTSQVRQSFDKISKKSLFLTLVPLRIPLQWKAFIQVKYTVFTQFNIYCDQSISIGKCFYTTWRIKVTIVVVSSHICSFDTKQCKTLALKARKLCQFDLHLMRFYLINPPILSTCAGIQHSDINRVDQGFPKQTRHHHR